MAKYWKYSSPNNDELVWNELSKVIEPEMGVSVVDLGLIDEIRIESENINIDFHLRMPDYPAALALFIAGDIKERMMALPGIVKAVVNLNDHIMSAQINRHINEAV